MSETLVPATYPLRLAGHLNGPLSRWLGMVKWWSLALPCYLLLGALTGGLAGPTGDRNGSVATLGLLSGDHCRVTCCSAPGTRAGSSISSWV